MESRIVYHMEKFVAFLFGEKNDSDSEQRIYNKLLRLEGEELDTWINTKIKKYITGKDVAYSEFSGENFEGIDGLITFKTWYKFHLDCESQEVMFIEEIYGQSGEEYVKLREKMINYQLKTLKYVRRMTCELDFITNYIEMLIMETNYDVLKAFIIQQVDPVEMK
jgi:hypothetical protein